MKKFKDETPEQMAKIVEALEEGNCEVYVTEFDTWEPQRSNRRIYTDQCYQIKPKLDSIDWSIFSPEYKHIRRAPEGGLLISENEPILNTYHHGSNFWSLTIGRHFYLDDPEVLTSYKDNGTPWNEMILDRPEGE